MIAGGDQLKLKLINLGALDILKKSLDNDATAIQIECAYCYANFIHDSDIKIIKLLIDDGVIDQLIAIITQDEQIPANLIVDVLK